MSLWGCEVYLLSGVGLGQAAPLLYSYVTVFLPSGPMTVVRAGLTLSQPAGPVAAFALLVTPDGPALLESPTPCPAELAETLVVEVHPSSRPQVRL